MRVVFGILLLASRGTQRRRLVPCGVGSGLGSCSGGDPRVLLEFLS